MNTPDGDATPSSHGEPVRGQGPARDEGVASPLAFPGEEKPLRALCERLGATPTQAATMAAQLLKRANQLATERGITREAALKHLLDLVVKGRSGEVPEGFGSE